MLQDDRKYEITRLIYEYVKSPSLRHIREPENLHKLAVAILKVVDGPLTPWEKWSDHRVVLLKGAVDVWVPDDDLLAALNRLPGPPLTVVDLAQRLETERGYHGPDEELREGCLAAYAEQKAAGTEMIAILGYLEMWMYEAGKPLHELRKQRDKERIAREKATAEARLRSGADCPWTEVRSIGAGVHCRKSGRLFRLAKASDLYPGMLEVTQVKALDDKRGTYIGRYHTRSEATKVLVELVRKPDWTA